MRYAPVFAFSVLVRNFHMRYTAEAKVQQRVRSLKFAFYFGNVKVSSNAFQVPAGQSGAMSSAKTTKVDPSLYYRADFFLDGPRKLNPDDIKKALAPASSGEVDINEHHRLAVEILGEDVRDGSWLKLAQCTLCYGTREWAQFSEINLRKHTLECTSEEVVPSADKRAKLSFHFDLATRYALRLPEYFRQ